MRLSRHTQSVARWSLSPDERLAIFDAIPDEAVMTIWRESRRWHIRVGTVAAVPSRHYIGRAFEKLGSVLGSAIAAEARIEAARE